ncbi:MAG: DUF1553 domain-containing protein [Planctomycetota bacterium]
MLNRLVVASLGLLVFVGGEAASQEVDGEALFRERVAPVLEKECWRCHGERRARGALRLHEREAALEGGTEGPALVPFDPDASLLVRAISYEDEDLQMPPSGPLPEDQIAAIRDWIEAGAPWADVTPSDEPSPIEDAPWSFRPVSVVAPPPETPWTRNPIDRFIADALGRAELTPSPEADRRTWIRRVTFDLTGLPPTPGRVESFVQDTRPGAFERLVDELLASPGYGERWARHWLDVVRFAETNGFEVNTPRPNAWPYRDWVIESFNEDRSAFDFVFDQIAGDTRGQDPATGFLVAGPWDAVKSPDVVLTKNQRDAELHDMVSTTASAFLGLTVGCAKCHDHKFDPISQRDYFSLRAFFQGVQHGERPWRTEAWIARDEERRQIEARLTPLRKRLDELMPIARTDLIAIPAEPVAKAPLAGGTVTQTVALEGDDFMTCWRPKRSGHFTVWALGPEVRIALDRDGDLATRDRTTLNATRHADGALITLGDVRLDASSILVSTDELQESSPPVLFLGEPPSSATPPSFREPVRATGNTDRFEPVLARSVRFTITRTNRFEPCIDELEILEALTGRNVALASEGAVATASGTYPGHSIHRLEHINDGSYGNSKSWISDEPGGGWVEIRLAAPTLIDRVSWARDREGVYADRLAISYHIEVTSDGESWIRVASSDDRLPEGDSLRDWPRSLQGLSASDAEEARLTRALATHLEARLPALATPPRVYAGVFDARPAPTHLLHRGDPMQEREIVAPATPEGISPRLVLPLDAGEAERRVALAGWLADPENPLVARVLVNRLWQGHFGTGLVGTPSDFGEMGTAPTHPELLDWLAGRLIQSGGSLKAIHRAIVLSSTYRQASVPRAAPLRVDADSRWLWRFPPRRLEAEAIRDAMLDIAGLLDPSRGGPGFSAFLPNENYVRVYEPKTAFGPEDWRRMIYQTKVRMEHDETFGVFDIPDGAQICPRRSRSTTPLQALSLMNSPFVLEQARELQRRLERETETLDARIDRAFSLAFGRLPSESERRGASVLAREHGLAMLCRALLNANEFLTLP